MVDNTMFVAGNSIPNISGFTHINRLKLTGEFDLRLTEYCMDNYAYDYSRWKNFNSFKGGADV